MATIQEWVPASLRTTPLGDRLFQRMVMQDWQPILSADISNEWLHACSASQVLTLTMPDERACRNYADWLHTVPATQKHHIATIIESTPTFLNAYGADTYHSTLLRLAVYGKPLAVMIKVITDVAWS